MNCPRNDGERNRIAGLMKSLPITIRGHAALREELKRRWQIERPRILRQVVEARGIEANSAESPEMRATLAEQDANEARIADLKSKLARAEVIDPAKLSGRTVKFGATVTLLDEDTGEKRALQIVGEAEADVEHGLISFASPVARALIGQTKGASVEVLTPTGPKMYEIKELQWR
jgi:transcription elongation factor GreA